MARLNIEVVGYRLRGLRGSLPGSSTALSFSHRLGGREVLRDKETIAHSSTRANYVKADYVGDKCAHVMQENIDLFIPVSVDLHTPLLHEQARKMPVQSESVAGNIRSEIAIHGCTPS